MDVVTELRVLLASGIPLVTVETAEVPRLVELLRAATGTDPLWIWSVASGLRRDGAQPLYGSTAVDQIVDNLAALSGRWTTVLCDPAALLADAVALRKLKEFAQRAQPGRTIVLVAAELSVPADLGPVVHPFTLPLPTPADLVGAIERVEVRAQQRGLGSDLVDGDRLRLARALSGLTMAEAEHELMRLAVLDGRLTPEDIERALVEKAHHLDQSGVLEIVPDQSGGLEALGGLAQLKDWLAPRLAAGLDRAVDPPRGVLLAGVPGCGKSAVARAVAHDAGVPLVLLDPARIYAKYVGESESRFDRALATVAAMAPAVLWIDEIEKGFAVGGEDGGVTDRILGTFLRWLQDRSAPVFVVATANDVTRLPPELTRKGRFDDLFFVDLPDAPARAVILRTILGARGVEVTDVDAAALAAGSDGFSGAELDAAVAAASYSGALTVASVADELATTVPLARARPSEIATLRDWAARHARAA